MDNLTNNAPIFFLLLATIAVPAMVAWIVGSVSWIVDETPAIAREFRSVWHWTIVPAMVAVDRRVEYYLTRVDLAVFAARYVNGPEYAAASIRRILPTIRRIVATLERFNSDNGGYLLIGGVYRWNRVALRDCDNGHRATLEILPEVMFFGVSKYLGNLVKTFGAFEPYARALNYLASPWPFRQDWNSTIKSKRADSDDAVSEVLDRLNSKPWNLRASVDDESILTVSIDWSQSAVDTLGADVVRYLTFAICMRATNNRARSAFSDLTPADVDAIVYDAAAARWTHTDRSSHTTRCVRSNNPAFKGTLLRQFGTKGGQWGRLAKTLTCYDEHDRDYYKGTDNGLAIDSGYSEFRAARNEYLYNEGMALGIPGALQLNASQIFEFNDKRASLRAQYGAE